MASMDTTIKQMDVWIPTPPALGNWSFFGKKLVSWVQITKQLHRCWSHNMLVTLLRRWGRI